MTNRIVFRQAARIELQDAASWYEEQRPGLGTEFLSEIDRAIDRAARAPFRGKPVANDVRRVSARRFPYAVYYRVRDDGLVILAVFHGRRDPLAWQRRK